MNVVLSQYFCYSSKRQIAKNTAIQGGSDKSQEFFVPVLNCQLNDIFHSLEGKEDTATSVSLSNQSLHKNSISMHCTNILSRYNCIQCTTKRITSAESYQLFSRDQALVSYRTLSFMHGTRLYYLIVCIFMYVNGDKSLQTFYINYRLKTFTTILTRARKKKEYYVTHIFLNL